MPSSNVQYTLLKGDETENDVGTVPFVVNDGRSLLQKSFCSRNFSIAKAFLLALLSTLVVAGVVAFSVRTTTKPDQWWKHAVVYQIYPRSFQDSDGDGTGDIQGIIQRLDYLQDIGINAVWISPMYKSPMADFGYDVSNYREIDPLFGTMNDFHQLVDEMHSKGIKLIMDYVPNHSSDQHEWFRKSVKREPPFDEYYVWKNGKCMPGQPKSADTCKVPNNWLSVFGNSSWTWNNDRQQYYYHSFLDVQPDLNYRSPQLRKEMKENLRFWLDKGVDGFRIDAVINLYENDTFADEPVTKDLRYINHPKNSYEHLEHIYTTNQPGTIEVVHEWAGLFRAYGKEHNKVIFSVAEMSWLNTLPEDMEYYDTGIDLPFNFALSNWQHGMSAAQLTNLVRPWIRQMPNNSWPNYVLGNHDQKRFTSRMGGPRYTDAGNMLLLTLPGTPTFYYGDEIAMTNIEVSYEDTRDPFGKKWGPILYKNFSRDPERSPMQWTDEFNSGFSVAQKTWLPIADNYTEVNVGRQKEAKNSHLSKFRELLKLRQESPFRAFGKNIIFYNSTFGGIDEPIFAFARTHDKNLSMRVKRHADEQTYYDYIVAMNPTTKSGEFRLNTRFVNCEVTFTTGDLYIPIKSEFTSHLLEPGDGVVLKCSSIYR